VNSEKALYVLHQSESSDQCLQALELVLNTQQKQQL
jgi:hypothetical protein